MVAPSTVITRYDLSKPFTEFDLLMNQKGYIAPQVLRPRIVGLQSADVGKIPLKQLLQQHDTARAMGSGYRRGDFEFDKYDYSTKEFGWEEPMDDRQIAVYGDLLDTEAIHADRAAGFVCDQYERAVASTVYNTTTWTGSGLTTELGTEWSNHASATPITNIFEAKEKVRSGTGLEPNALVCNTLQLHHLANCDETVDRVKYTQTADQGTMLQAIADVLGIPKIIVAGGWTNSANPQQSASISRIWGNEYAMVCRVAETEDPSEPCIGRTFIWSGDGPGAVGTEEKLALIMEEYREERVRGSVMRARNDRDIVIMYAAAGHLLSNVIAP